MNEQQALIALEMIGFTLPEFYYVDYDVLANASGEWVMIEYDFHPNDDICFYLKFAGIKSTKERIEEILPNDLVSYRPGAVFRLLTLTPYVSPWEYMRYSNGKFAFKKPNLKLLP